MAKKKPRAAFSYYGGKQRIASKIVPLLPPHSTYVEPFAGGAAVMFAKGRPPGATASEYREVLNDINGRIVNFYRVLQTDADELVHRIEHTPYARAEYERAKEWADRDGVDGAWSWFVDVSMSFGNSVAAGSWSMTQPSGSATSTTNHAAMWNRKDIRAIADRLKGGGVH